MGAGIAASPHLHRAKDLPVFASLAAFAPRSSILAHQLRRRFQSWSSPKAGSRSSAALLGLIPFASPAPRGSRELRLEDQLFRRLFRLVRLGPKPSSSPSGGDRSFRHLPHLLAVAGFPGRRELPSRSQLEPAKLFRVAQREKSSLCLWITWISRITRKNRAGIPPNMASRRAL